jgi:hypothetical protein
VSQLFPPKAYSPFVRLSTAAVMTTHPGSHKLTESSEFLRGSTAYQEPKDTTCAWSQRGEGCWDRATHYIRHLAMMRTWSAQSLASSSVLSEPMVSGQLTPSAVDGRL